jgi:hypothetical protein
VIGIAHAAVGAAVFAGLYIAVIKEGCLYDLKAQDFDRFRETGSVCAAPIWVSALLKSDASWGATMGGAAMLLCFVHDRLLFWIAALCGVAYTAGSLALLVAFAALDVPPFPWVASAAFFTLAGLAETAIAYQAAATLPLLTRASREPAHDDRDAQGSSALPTGSATVLNPAEDAPANHQTPLFASE